MDLMDLLGNALQQQGGIDQISRETGIDKEKVASVVGGAVPMMMGALARNSAQTSGAEALASALNRDHDGSILDDVVSALGRSAVQRSGAGALGHIFGSRQDQTTAALGKMSGLDGDSVTRILALLAPLVLGALGRSQRPTTPPATGGTGFDLGGLAAALAGGRKEAERRAPQSGMLTQILDRDGDGDVTDDLTGLGAGLLGSLFKS